MRTERYRSGDLVELFRRQKIATMAELKATLGTGAPATVFRKLGELSYRTSYSHRGRYYTLDDIPDYDEWGLWSLGAVRFSRCGTLLYTAEALVEEVDMGFVVPELEALLQVEVKGALLNLVRQRRLARQKLTGRRYLYTSAEPAKRRRQVTARQVLEAESVPTGLLDPDVMPDELKAAIILFFSLLDEKQRRLYAGLESLKFGHGGNRKLAELLGLDAGTVARGRRELLAQDVEVEHVRRAGAGRKSVEKKRQR